MVRPAGAEEALQSVWSGFAGLGRAVAQGLLEDILRGPFTGACALQMVYTGSTVELMKGEHSRPLLIEKRERGALVHVARSRLSANPEHMIGATRRQIVSVDGMGRCLTRTGCVVAIARQAGIDSAAIAVITFGIGKALNGVADGEATADNGAAVPIGIGSDNLKDVLARREIGDIDGVGETDLIALSIAGIVLTDVRPGRIEQQIVVLLAVNEEGQGDNSFVVEDPSGQSHAIPHKRVFCGGVNVAKRRERIVKFGDDPLYRLVVAENQVCSCPHRPQGVDAEGEERANVIEDAALLPALEGGEAVLVVDGNAVVEACRL